MTRQSWRGWAVFGLLALVCLTSAQSAEVAQASVAFENTLDIDLAPKIDVAMLKRERFAVDVPHAVDPASAGSWERASGTSVWRYSVRIPSAVSMSFHAALFRLPSESSLAVTDAAGARALYSPGDGGELGLWSRVARGDSLRFELRVPTRDESQVVFAIASLQAGYRVLGGEGADHPHYRKRLAASPAALNAACTENFACHETPQNSRNADATAAIVIGGVALCTATLINNVRNDGTPYLLTARHCQDNPSSGVVVYWDAVKPCGAVLGSVYDTQTGAYLHSTETVF
jgi:lysyl endopeptidase